MFYRLKILLEMLRETEVFFKSDVIYGSYKTNHHISFKLLTVVKGILPVSNDILPISFIIKN